VRMCSDTPSVARPSGAEKEGHAGGNAMGLFSHSLGGAIAILCAKHFLQHLGQ